MDGWEEITRLCGAERMCECRVRGSGVRSLAGSLSCCTSLQHPKGLQHEQDQTHPGELAWALGEEVSHTLCPNGSISREVCGHPGAGTAGPRLARAAALPQRSPFPPSPPFPLCPSFPSSSLRPLRCSAGRQRLRSLLPPQVSSAQSSP